MDRGLDLRLRTPAGPGRDRGAGPQAGDGARFQRGSLQGSRSAWSRRRAPAALSIDTAALASAVKLAHEIARRDRTGAGAGAMASWR